jgi:hypothetical protein
MQPMYPKENIKLYALHDYTSEMHLTLDCSSNPRVKFKSYTGQWNLINRSDREREGVA